MACSGSRDSGRLIAIVFKSMEASEAIRRGRDPPYNLAGLDEAERRTVYAGETTATPLTYPARTLGAMSTI